MQEVRGMRENGVTISFVKDSTKLSRGGSPASERRNRTNV
jgi:hypothetical protein